MTRQHITLISFGHFKKRFLDQVAESVHREFACPVAIKEVHLDLMGYFDPARRQYNGNKLLKVVDELDCPDSVKVVGLFNVDLFIPILTFIFGQAILNGRTAIASLFRLSNEWYGLGPDEDLLLDRFTKVVIHELGHAFGLVHCTVPTCIMRAGTYVEDIDQKKQGFCSGCREKLPDRACKDLT